MIILFLAGSGFFLYNGFSLLFSEEAVPPKVQENGK